MSVIQGRCQTFCRTKFPPAIVQMTGKYLYCVSDVG